MPMYPTMANQSNLPMQMPTGFNTIVMPGMWSQPGFPLPASQMGYMSLSQPMLTTSSTPSSSGFVQGERRTSFDPNLSPSFLTEPTY